MKYSELKQIFRELKRTSPKDDLTAHIIFTEDSFATPYPLLSRTYRVSSDNKAFWPNMGGYSIFAYCLEKTSDQGVRLDRYMICYGFGETCIRVWETVKSEKVRLEPLAGNQAMGDE